jgi:hypothetical protein
MDRQLRATENKASALDGRVSSIIRPSFPPASRVSPEMDSSNKFPAKIIQIHQHNDDNKKLAYSFILKAF